MSAETIEPTTPLEKHQAAELARLREVLEDMQADNAKLTAENASLREGWSHEV